jgi:hypothetical protein
VFVYLVLCDAQLGLQDFSGISVFQTGGGLSLLVPEGCYSDLGIVFAPPPTPNFIMKLGTLLGFLLSKKAKKRVLMML